MDKISIVVEPRKILGKKVKQLRREGLIPANIFGKDLKSVSIQMDQKEFRKIFKAAGETGIVEVKVKDEKYPSLIHKVQKDPVSGSVIHADFHKVNLKEKITANVPVKLEGESPAEKSGIGLILQTISEIEVESLPADIPHQIDVDISKLTEVGQAVHVKDLKIDTAKVEVKNDPEATVLTVQTAEMKEEKEEEVVSPQEVEATAEKGEEEQPEAEGGEKATEESADKPSE